MRAIDGFVVALSIGTINALAEEIVYLDLRRFFGDRLDLKLPVAGIGKKFYLWRGRFANAGIVGIADEDNGDGIVRQLVKKLCSINIVAGFGGVEGAIRSGIIVLARIQHLDGVVKAERLIY